MSYFYYQPSIEESDEGMLPDNNDTAGEGGTICHRQYIPTVSEYANALGGYHTALMVVGTLLTVGLYGLFFEQIFFIYNNVNKAFRTHVLWITSVCPFMSLMSLMTVIVPRSASVCTGVKVTYMCIGITHFMDLTTILFGSEKKMLAQFRDSKLKLQVGPVCCVFFCCPTPQVSRVRLMWVRWMLYQMPFLQAFYSVLGILLATGLSESGQGIDPNTSFLWISVINLVSFSTGVYALNILTELCGDPLSKYNYRMKALAMKLLILTTNFQNLFLNLLMPFNIFPCPSPYIPPPIWKLTLEMSMYLAELMLIGPFTYWQYRNIHLLTKNSPPEIDPQSSYSNTPHIIPKFIEAGSQSNITPQQQHELEQQHQQLQGQTANYHSDITPMQQHKFEQQQQQLQEQTADQHINITPMQQHKLQQQHQQLREQQAHHHSDITQEPQRPQIEVHRERGITNPSFTNSIEMEANVSQQRNSPNHQHPSSREGEYEIAVGVV